VLTDKEFQRLLKETPPVLLLGESKNKKGQKSSRIHLVLTSADNLVMLRYQRKFWDTLCKKQEDYVKRAGLHLLNPHPVKMTEDLSSQLCPRCVHFARRLLSARKSINGGTIRYLEEHHV